MNSGSKQSGGKEDKKNQPNSLKLKTNDEAYGAPNAKPVILIA
jgi:hypothetical protein